MFCNALLLAVGVVIVNGFPSGAPLEACGNLLPQHAGFQPSTILSPFTVNFRRQTYEPLERRSSKLLYRYLASQLYYITA